MVSFCAQYTASLTARSWGRYKVLRRSARPSLRVTRTLSPGRSDVLASTRLDARTRGRSDVWTFERSWALLVCATNASAAPAFVQVGPPVSGKSAARVVPATTTLPWRSSAKPAIPSCHVIPTGVATGDVHTGQVKLLEDRDGDGFYEHATVFADHLRFPTSVMPWNGGLLVASAPDLYYLRDAGGADFGPTDTALSLTDMIEKDLAGAKAEYKTLMEKDIPAFNKTLAASGVTPISGN